MNEVKDKNISVQDAIDLRDRIIDGYTYSINDILNICSLAIIFKDHINSLKEDRKELIQVIGFLRCCVLTGEKLSDVEDERIMKIVKKFV